MVNECGWEDASPWNERTFLKSERRESSCRPILRFTGHTCVQRHAGSWIPTHACDGRGRWSQPLMLCVWWIVLIKERTAKFIEAEGQSRTFIIAVDCYHLAGRCCYMEQAVILRISGLWEAGGVNIKIRPCSDEGGWSLIHSHSGKVLRSTEKCSANENI